jgi:hypothetical protein
VKHSLQSLALIQSPFRKTAVSSANNIPLGCFKMYVDLLSFVKTRNTLVSSSAAEKNEFYLAHLKYDTKSSPRLTGVISCSVALHPESLSLTILVLVAEIRLLPRMMSRLSVPPALQFRTLLAFEHWHELGTQVGRRVYIFAWKNMSPTKIAKLNVSQDSRLPISPIFPHLRRSCWTVAS